MNPFLIIGKPLMSVQKGLGTFSIEPLHLSLEEDEQQEYCVEPESGEWEATLDHNNIIRTVFLYLKEGCDGILGLDYSMSRQDVVGLLGEPISQGEAHFDPMLGEYGAWEKFVYENLFVHVEHEHKESNIKLITIMSS